MLGRNRTDGGSFFLFALGLNRGMSEGILAEDGGVGSVHCWMGSGGGGVAAKGAMVAMCEAHPIMSLQR